MNGKKPAAKKGLLPKLKGFLDALGDRYHRVLQVIDEALASENLKDKIWAVDLILKRTPTPDPMLTKDAIASSKQAIQTTIEEDISQLSNADLLARIRRHLGEPEA